MAETSRTRCGARQRLGQHDREWVIRMSDQASNRAEYDDIAQDYVASKQLPFRLIVEAPTLFGLAGDVSGLSVLDLACGGGTYSRAFARRGAAAVVGADLSQGMIDQARAEEQASPLGISYRVGDAATLGVVGAFDLVVAAYLFNYAQTRAQLYAFARTVHANLKPGGRLIGINDNPRNDPSRYGVHTGYGFSRDIALPRQEGSRIRYTFQTSDGTAFGFDNFWLAPETYHAVFAEAGLAGFRFVDAAADRADGHDAALWDDFLRDCPITGLVAHRSA